jgi:hypothetical protein
MEETQKVFNLKRVSFKTLHLKTTLDVNVEGIGIIGKLIGKVAFRLNTFEELNACFFPHTIARITHNGEYLDVYSLKTTGNITRYASNQFNTKMKFINIIYDTFPYTENGEKLVLMNVPTGITLKWESSKIRKYKIEKVCSSF